MKFQSNTLLQKLSKESVARLTKIVDETPDVIIPMMKKPAITSAQLWNIQNRKRVFRGRRFLQL